MKKQMKGSLILLLAMTMLFSVGFISAAAASMTTPVTGGNYTSPITITVVANNAGLLANFTNVTCYYNASGGAAFPTVLATILNTSQAQTTFTTTAALSSAVRTYNISCELRNSSTLNATLYASAITSDNTSPLAAIEVDDAEPSQGRQAIISWTDSDALSGLLSTLVTVTSPDTARCPTQTFTTANSNTVYIDQETTCAGTYTATILATDYSGNTNTASTTFKVRIPNGKFIGEHSIASLGSSNDNQTAIVVVIVIILVLLIWQAKK